MYRVVYNATVRFTAGRESSWQYRCKYHSKQVAEDLPLTQNPKTVHTPLESLAEWTQVTYQAQATTGGEAVADESGTLRYVGRRDDELACAAGCASWRRCGCGLAIGA